MDFLTLLSLIAVPSLSQIFGPRSPLDSLSGQCLCTIYIFESEAKLNIVLSGIFASTSKSKLTLQSIDFFCQNKPKHIKIGLEIDEL
jgi:hypothetical protein